MARVFITGSSDGLGLMAGRLLAGQGHAVVLHARNSSRAEDAAAALPEAAGVVTGDLSSLADAQWERRPWDGFLAYSDSKLLDVVLTFAVARRWPDVRCNGVEPGWVPTKMGGPTASDDLALAPVTQVWLAVSNDPAATRAGLPTLLAVSGWPPLALAVEAVRCSPRPASGSSSPCRRTAWPGTRRAERARPGWPPGTPPTRTRPNEPGRSWPRMTRRGRPKCRSSTWARSIPPGTPRDRASCRTARR